MSRVLGAELLKLRTTRTAGTLGSAAVGLTLLILLVGILVSDQNTPGQSLDAVDVSLAPLFVFIGAIVGVTGEYRHGTISASFLVVPVRRRQLAAQAIAYALAGVALAAATWALQLAVGLPLLSSDGSPAPAGGELAGIIPREVLATALLGVLGVGLGALVRNQAGAIVVALVGVLFVEPTLAALVPKTDGYGPIGAAAALAGHAGDDVPSHFVGGLVLAAWAAGLCAAGTIVTERRDVG